MPRASLIRHVTSLLRIRHTSQTSYAVTHKTRRRFVEYGKKKSRHRRDGYIVAMPCHGTAVYVAVWLKYVIAWMKMATTGGTVALPGDTRWRQMLLFCRRLLWHCHVTRWHNTACYHVILLFTLASRLMPRERHECRDTERLSIASCDIAMAAMAFGEYIKERRCCYTLRHEQFAVGHRAINTSLLRHVG